MNELELVDGRLALNKWKNKLATFELVRDGCINLFYKTEVYLNTIEKLKNESIDIYVFDAIDWNKEENFYSSFSKGMNFPDYFGNNLDAINDCLGDLINKNIAICISNYENFMIKCQKQANILPKIILTNCWEAILQENVMLMLIQTNNGSISFNDIKEFPPKWNQKEWLNKNHGL